MTAPLESRHRKLLANIMRRKIYKRNQEIVKQGSVADTIYFIERGQVNIIQTTRAEPRGRVLQTLRAGDVFGSEAFRDMGGHKEKDEDKPTTRESSRADSPSGDEMKRQNLQERKGEGKFQSKAIVDEEKKQPVYSASVVAASASGTTILSIRRSDAEEALGPLHKLIQVTENVRTLRGVSIFSSLDLPQLDDLAGKMDHRVYSNHDIIFHENSNSGEFFIIQSGEVEFQKNKNTVGRLFGSEYFGEGSAIMNKPRRATAVAASQNVVCSVISGNDLREIIGGGNYSLSSERHLRASEEDRLASGKRMHPG